MKNIKKKNIIILFTILFLLILPKFIFSPLSNRRKEVPENAKKWMYGMENKINKVNETAKNNNIACDYMKGEKQLFIAADKSDLPVDDFEFSFCLTIVDDTNGMESFATIYTEKSDKEISILDYKSWQALINAVTEQNTYNYSSMNKKIKESIKKCKKEKKEQTINEKINDYDVNFQTYINQDNKLKFQLEIKKGYKFDKI